MALNENLLEICGVSKSFSGIKVLDGVSFNVKKGSVHALMGENGAGKSTLMKCLFGMYKKDGGIIKFCGKEVDFSSPKDALQQGVAMVHQELNQVLQLSVADNMWLGRYPNNLGIISKSLYYENTLEIFKDLELNIDPYMKVGNLSVSDRQMVEIAKAISYEAKIFVLDEPTSSLADEEAKRLFKIIRKLKNNGYGIIYISHKMEEILSICDQITIMRDGKIVTTQLSNEMTTEKIINYMVGRELKNRYPKKRNAVSDSNILEVHNLSSKYIPAVKNVSFNLKSGEVLGVAGLAGSGRTELLETIFGLKTALMGEVYLNGKRIFNSSPRNSIKNGFALITEERRKDGIFGVLDIVFNSVISVGYMSKFGIINNKKSYDTTEEIVEKLRIKAASVSTKIKNLSGGNQQKVILGRWLLTKPTILLLDEPTRGIDVGAKYEIYQIIAEMAAEGKGVIVASSEMPELLGICDRIMIMSGGKVAGIESADSITQERIMELSAKYI